MQYQFVTGLIKSIISAVENTGVAIVRTLNQRHDVRVTNPVKKVDVKGQVVVSNLKNLEPLFKKLKDATLQVKSSVDNIPSEITVKNFPQSFEVSNLSNKDVVDSLSKLSQEVQSLHKPLSNESVNVVNQPIKELKAIQKELAKSSDSIVQKISKIKLDPKIMVQAPKPERLVVPPAQVTVERVEIDYKKLAKELVPLAVDYKKLSKAISDEITGMVITGGGGGSSYSFSDSSGNKTHALVDENRHQQVDVVSMPSSSRKYLFHDSYKNGIYEYVGFVAEDGYWQIMRVSENPDSVRYARGSSNYATNWTNRESLDYDYVNLSTL